MSYSLGLLDQSPIFPEQTAEDAFAHTISLAKHAEAWGYERFWVAEHHHMQHVAGASPEVLLAHLLAHTTTLRFASGGVMLQHYSPYKVAENFHVLASLAPGRVDIGVGKAPGGFQLSTEALQVDSKAERTDFADRLLALQQFIEHELPGSHPFTGLQATPLPSVKPEIYLLGASENSAKLAASCQTHFVFARFLNNDEGVLEAAARLYHTHHHGGKLLAAVAVLAADTTEAAQSLAKDIKLFDVTFADGRTLTVQSAKQVEQLAAQTEASFQVKEKAVAVIAGTAADIRMELDRLHHAYQIDEFVLHTPTVQQEVRWRSFELLSPLQVKEEISR